MRFISLGDYAPVELGLPEKFEQFRPSQIEAVEHIYHGEKRFQALALPTGSGKTLIAMAAAKATGRRTAILTSTLGLMRQYQKDFETVGVIRGRSNYECNGAKCESNCQDGYLDGCRREMNCVYQIHRRIAKSEPVVLTNYAYWIRVHKFGPALERSGPEGRPNPFEMLVLDEAHEAMEELSRALQIDIKQSWLTRLKIHFKTSENIEYWSSFIGEHFPLIVNAQEEAVLLQEKDPSDEHRHAAKELTKFREAATELKDIRSEHWICEMKPGAMGWGRVWQFHPIWPARWNEKLFLSIPHVVLMSATMRPTALRMLGIPKEESSFREWPRVFPAQYTPIYQIKNEDETVGPVSVRIDAKADEKRLEKWVSLIDAVIGARLDRKGLIHTVSYARQDYLLKHSQYAYLMMANTQDPDSPTAVETVELFKAAAAPRVLVSPSFSTGWDFPGVTCEYQIIAKVPFPDSRNPLMKARLAQSQIYGNHLTMQELVQACGRGTRHELDRCEIFIVDDHISWFFYRNKSLAPAWFNIVQIQKIPKAPPKLAADKLTL